MTTVDKKVFESTEKPGKSTSEVFWLRIMNDIIRPRFLKVKEKQQNQCMQMDTFQKYYECYQYQSNRLEEDTVEMEFFARKFDTCVEEGTRALYTLKRVEDICSHKIINIIKETTSIRRKKEKEQKLLIDSSATNLNKPAQSSTELLNSIESKSTENQSITKQSYIKGHKLSWEEKKSLEPSTILKS